MNPRMLELAQRHGNLRARIENQREMLAKHAEPLESVFSVADKALAGVDWVKQHPGTVGTAIAVLATIKPRRAWRWAKRGLFVWRSWQSVRNKLIGER